MKKVLASLIFGAAFVAAAANAADVSENNYPNVEHAVSPVQQNLVVDQSGVRDSAYPRVRSESTENRSEVQRELAAYNQQHPVDEYLN